MKRFLAIFTILTLVLTTLCSEAAPSKRGKPRSKEGSYTLIVAGIVTGEGRASVSGDQLTITADVVSESGKKGSIVATVTLTKNHFDGTGTVMGQTASFSGRLDQPSDATERTIKGVRFTCTFKTASKEFGRIIGNLPTAAPATTGRTVDGPTTHTRDRDDDHKRGERRGQR